MVKMQNQGRHPDTYADSQNSASSAPWQIIPRLFGHVAPYVGSISGDQILEQSPGHDLDHP